MFTGLSSLRKEEKKEPTVQNKALQDYLKKYTGGPTDDGQDKRKRKKKKPKAGGPSAVSILDEDISGFQHLPEAAPVEAKLQEPADDEDDEPVVANPEEAEAFRIQLEKSKNFYQKSQDGSGWAVASADNSQQQHRQQQPRQRHDSPDLSPPRRNGMTAAANGAAAASRTRKRSLSPDVGDLSPPRRGTARHDSLPAAAAAGDNLSPPRRGRHRHDSPGDVSPPRRRREDSSAAAAAGGGRGDRDLSPPRRSRQRHDLSPDTAAAAAAVGSRCGSVRDLSPPRRGRQRHDSPVDASPPRRSRHDSLAAAAAAAKGDLSPPRRGRQRHDSPPAAAAAAGDLSPPRRGRQRHGSTVPDVSPPRRKRDRSPSPSAAAAAAAAAAGGGGGGGDVPRMGDGTAAGLVSSRQLAEATARLKAQAEERKRQAAGRGESTVYRDKVTGRVISAEEYTEQQAKARQKKPPPEEINVAWKGGLAQQRAAIEAAQAAAREAAKSFHRGFDVDADLELKERDRWGDPMAGKLKKKKRDEFDLPVPVITETNKAAMEASGFIVPQEVPPHSWLRRGVAAPVNRYNIRPGRHWDGVDRSNGFEKEMFKSLNQQRAQELEARMWAQEDM